MLIRTVERKRRTLVGENVTDATEPAVAELGASCVVSSNPLGWPSLLHVPQLRDGQSSNEGPWFSVDGSSVEAMAEIILELGKSNLIARGWDDGKGFSNKLGGKEGNAVSTAVREPSCQEPPAVQVQHCGKRGNLGFLQPELTLPRYCIRMAT